MVTPRDALQAAVRSLTDGPGDPSSIEGSKINALESIAWGLIGLLAKQIQDPAAMEDLSGALKDLGLVRIPGR